MREIDPDNDSQLIRSAATIMLWRRGNAGPEVLMGQRGAQAVFMPSKYVFPGGAVEAADDAPMTMLEPTCQRRVLQFCAPLAPSPSVLIGAGVRELAEETGLVLPTSAKMRFVFRAITPPGRPRRFDARFFLAAADDLDGDPDDFSAASDELTHLHWIALSQARGLDLPFITEVVIAEVSAMLAGQTQTGVPFFDNSGTTPTFRWLR